MLARMIHPFRQVAVVLCLLAVPAAGVLSGCGGGDTPKPVTSVAATTRAATVNTSPAAASFKRHVGLALDALRTGIQKPYEQGAFTSGGVDMVLAFTKAASSASVALRELDAARRVAASNAGLGEVGGQVDSLLGHVTTLVGSATDGNIDAGELKLLLDDVDALGRTARAAGIDIPATTTPVTPGTPAP